MYSSSIIHNQDKTGIPTSSDDNNTAVEDTTGNKADDNLDPPSANSSNSSGGGNSGEVVNIDYDDYDDDYQEPQTAKDYVRYYTVMALQWTFILGVAASALYTLNELFPGRMGPNNIYSEVFDLLRVSDEITRITGANPTAFGRDTHNEGRRNHVDSYKYKADDGIDRQRIRFHIKGNRGHVIVYVENVKNTKPGEFVYVICRDVRTNRVLTIQDNRSEYDTTPASTTAEGEQGSKAKDPLSSLLSGFSK